MAAAKPSPRRRGAASGWTSFVGNPAQGPVSCGLERKASQSTVFAWNRIDCSFTSPTSTAAAGPRSRSIAGCGMGCGAMGSPFDAAEAAYGQLYV